MSVFTERFANLIKEKGFTQKQVAQRTNLTESAISRYIKGDRVPRGAILLNIANALGTTTDYLQGLTNDPNFMRAGDEVAEAFRLIARHADHLTAEEKERFARILFGGNS